MQEYIFSNFEPKQELEKSGRSEMIWPDSDDLKMNQN